MKYLNKSFSVSVTGLGKSCDTCKKTKCKNCTMGYTEYININNKTFTEKLIDKLRGKPE
jgi:hypothetical protein